MMSQPPADTGAQTAAAPGETPAHGIVFFDGHCGLCNGFVDSILRLPARERFRFSPRQGAAFSTLLERHSGLAHCDSIIYLPPGRDTTPLARSDAVIGIFLQIGGARAVAARLLRRVPRPLRDFGYRIVARLRHLLSRRRETCRLPTPEERAFFLD